MDNLLVYNITLIKGLHVFQVYYFIVPYRFFAPYLALVEVIFLVISRCAVTLIGHVLNV